MNKIEDTARREGWAKRIDEDFTGVEINHA